VFLLVPAHLGCPGQNLESRKTVVCEGVHLQLWERIGNWFSSHTGL